MANSGYLNELPFDNEFIVNNDERIEIRNKLKCAEDVDAWLSSYKQMTGTHWSVRNTYPRLQRLHFRKDYVCHHSGFHKETASGGYNKRGKSKNFQCPVRMSIFILLWTSGDMYAKKGLLGKIIIIGQHNHSTSNAEALSLLPAPDSLRSIFEGYFCDGYGISEAMRRHAHKMERAGCTETDLADATKNPKYRTVSHWNRQWRAKRHKLHTANNQLSLSNQSSSGEHCEPAPQSHESMDHQMSDESTAAVTLPPVTDDRTILKKSVLDAMEHLDNQFGSSTAGWTLLLTRLNNVRSRTQWETFLHSFGGGVPHWHRHRAAIRVQQTSLPLGGPAITRASKRIANRRPSSSDALHHKAK